MIWEDNLYRHQEDVRITFRDLLFLFIYFFGMIFYFNVDLILS